MSHFQTSWKPGTCSIEKKQDAAIAILSECYHLSSLIDICLVTMH